MSGRRLGIAFLIFLAIFTAGLIYTQFFAYYVRDRAVAELPGGIAVRGYDGIDSASSPLKLRGCFELDPAAVAALPPAPDATPLNAPFWFRCFDAGRLTRDLADGTAAAYRLATDRPEGFDELVAVYPDGRGYLWRQLNARYR